MQNADIIRAGVAYIEQNLKTDITPEELAQMAGYSVWHYQHLFAQVIGVPLAVYIKRRRLDRALEEINAKRKAIDVAMEYGFDTYAGFYKAFLNMYGCSPKKYLSLYGTHQSKSEVSFMYNEKGLRKILTNWDIPQDQAISGVKIVDGTKTADNAWQIGKNYILKTGDRAMLLRNVRTANAVESYHRMVRKFTKSKAIFPTDDSIRKVIYMSVSEISKKWTMPIRDWGLAYAQFAIFFEDRFVA